MAETTNSARDMIDEHIYKLLAGGALLLVVIGTVGYRIIEDWSWVDSLYFSVVAVTTVGFGDLTPSSDGSKLFTVFYILTGITLVTSYLNVRFKRKAQRREGRHHSGRSDAAKSE